MSRGGPLWLWLHLLAGALPLPIIWALANPLFASPDEPAHMVRAQGAIRGDFRSPYRTDGLPVDAHHCLAHRPTATADCLALAWGPAGRHHPSKTDTYPPLFHLLAGVPSLLIGGPAGAYAMRLWLALVCSAMLAWATVLLWTRCPGRWALASLCLAMAPAVVFATAMVNPSGLAAAFAALIWAAGINVTRPQPGTLARASAVTLVAALVLYPLQRRDAGAWEVVLLLILASTLTGPRVRALRRDPLLLAGLALAAISMGWVWVAWTGTAAASFVAKGARSARGSSLSGVDALPAYALELLGNFGWLDTPLPTWTSLIELGAIASVLAVAMIAGSRPEARVSAMALFAMCVAPVAVAAIRFPYLQARYLFPLFVGAVFMAGQSLAGSRLPEPASRRLFALAVGAMALVQYVAFATNLRRYAVGATGSWWFVGAAAWQPPMMSNATALLLAALAILTSAAIGRHVLCAAAATRQPQNIVHRR